MIIMPQIFLRNTKPKKKIEGVISGYVNSLFELYVTLNIKIDLQYYNTKIILKIFLDEILKIYIKKKKNYG